MTTVVVSVESRYDRTPDGRVWTKDGPAHRFFARYLAAFDDVRVLARVRDVALVPGGAHRVDGDRVSVRAVPYYHGTLGYLRHWPAVRRAARAAAGDADAVILRAPTVMALPLAAHRQRRGLPYAVEVMGDAYDVFAPGVIRHPLRPWLRRRYTGRLRRLCARATAVAYVTEAYLQRRYPAAPAAVTAVYSSVDLPEAAFVTAPRTPHGPPWTVISVGTLEQPYKGIDTLVRAVALLLRDGTDVRLVHVGDGRHRPALARLADRLGVADRVELTGTLAGGAPIRARLDDADLFAMPSRTEGLPKALLEAMARGLPAVGSTVGGIPELLPPECLVPPDDPAALADAITRTLADGAARSAANLRRARDYAADALTPRRTELYRALRSAMDRSARV